MLKISIEGNVIMSDICIQNISITIAKKIKPCYFQFADKSS
jgi:hypothetical protein